MSWKITIFRYLSKKMLTSSNFSQHLGSKKYVIEFTIGYAICISVHDPSSSGSNFRQGDDRVKTAGPDRVKTHSLPPFPILTCIYRFQFDINYFCILLWKIVKPRDHYKVKPPIWKYSQINQSDIILRCVSDLDLSAAINWQLSKSLSMQL